MILRFLRKFSRSSETHAANSSKVNAADIKDYIIVVSKTELSRSVGLAYSMYDTAPSGKIFISKDEAVRYIKSCNHSDEWYLFSYNDHLCTEIVFKENC